MPPWLHNLVKVDYIIGWRMSELLGIQTDQLNFKLGTLTLYESKNGEGRVFTFAVFPELREYLEEQFHSTNKWRVANQFQATALFHREGKPIAYTTFWKYWKLARDKVNQERLEAGQPPLARVALAHDFRRTAARNMRARGVPTEMIMELVGWKTFKMLRRYLIVDTASLNQATAQLAAGGRLIPANSPADYPSDPLAQEKPQQIQGNSLP
jgi:integrase